MPWKRGHSWAFIQNSVVTRDRFTIIFCLIFKFEHACILYSFYLVFCVVHYQNWKMSQAYKNESMVGLDNDLDEAPIELGVTQEICLPLKIRNVMFQVTSPMLHLLQIKGLFGGQAIEGANRHLKNFADVCLPFKTRNISQKSIHLRLFPFLLTWEDTSWLVQFFLGSITYWAELKVDFLERFFLPSRMLS